MNYSKEFKDEALKLSDEIGIKKSCDQLGLKYYTLAQWRKSRKVKLSEPINQLTDVEARARICELEKKNAELARANDILKDISIFLIIISHNTLDECPMAYMILLITSVRLQKFTK